MGARPKSVSVRSLLAAMVVGALLYAGALGTYLLWALQHTARSLGASAAAVAEEYDSIQVRRTTLGEVFNGVDRLSIEESGPPDSALIESLFQRVKSVSGQTVGVRAITSPLRISAPVRARLADAAGVESELAGILMEALEDLRASDHQAARAWVTRARSTRAALTEQFDGVQRLGLLDIANRQRLLAASAHRAVDAIAAWMALGALLALLAMALVHRRLFGPLRELDIGLAHVARGELDTSLKVRRVDEMGRLKAHFNEMTHVLRTRPEVEALRASEVRFRSLIEHGMDLISILGDDHRLRYASPAITRILGYGQHELEGHNVLDLVRLEDLGRVQAAFHSALADHSSEVRVEYGYRHKDGSWRFLETVVTDVSDQPAVGGFVLNTRDITERRHAELALEKSRERFAKLFRAAPIAMDLAVLGDGRILDVNDEFVHLFGYRRGELLGNTSLSVGLWVNSPDRTQMVEALKQLGSADHRVARLRTKDGRVRRVRCTTQRMELSGEAVILSAFVDVTEREETERRLVESEARFRTAFMTGSDAYLIASVDDGRIVESNERFETMYGYTRHEAVGRTSLELAMWADPEALQLLAAEVVAEGRVEDRILRARRKGGEIFEALCSFSLLPGANSRLMLEVIRDVSEVRRAKEAIRSLEDQFRQAQRLEAVGRLAGGVAHDFNNILTVILASSSLLLSSLEPGDPRRSDAEEIRDAALRAGSLTRQLLAFSGKQVLRPRLLDLNAVVTNLQRMLPRLLGENVAVEFVLEPELGTIRADPGQLDQVIINLAVNAKDAMPEGGQLTIRTSNSELDESSAAGVAGAAPGRFSVLTIADTGTGIAPENLAHIFEPFFTTKELAKGTGLGLSTVHGIVVQSGGFVTVSSELGRGSTFEIYLPQTELAAASTEAERESEEIPKGRETILLAEDDAGVRNGVNAILAQAGYRVLAAPDGETALEMAKAHPGDIHLLVTDLVMPGINGRELAERLRTVKPGTRVLYMSGHSDDEVLARQIGEGSIPFLQKPFTRETLASQVRAALDEP